LRSDLSQQPFGKLSVLRFSQTNASLSSQRAAIGIKYVLSRSINSYQQSSLRSFISMSAYIKDSIFGITVNYLTNHRLFPHPEEKSDFQIPSQFLPPNATSSNSPRPRIQSLRSGLSRASTLNVTPPQEDKNFIKESDEDKAIPQDSPEKLTPDDIEKAMNGTGAPEPKAQVSDPNIVGWYSDNDPENPQ
jgi:hypothetical protein